MGTLKVSLGNGKYLVAETGGDNTYKEIFVGIETEDGYYTDLAVIGENYAYSEEDVIPLHDEYKIRIYDPMQACEMINEIILEDKYDIKESKS